MTTIKSIGIPGFVLITLGLALSGFIAYLFTTEKGRHLRDDLAERTTELAKTAGKAMPRVRKVHGESPATSMHETIQH